MERLVPRIRAIAGGSLALALLPCAANAQTVVGTVDLQFQSINQQYNLFVNEAGSQTVNAWAAVQTLAATNLSSGSLGLSNSSTLAMFCVELGQDSPNSPALYQIFDSSSVAYADSTNLPGTPDAQASPSTLFETPAAITATGGIGGYRAGELELLYGYAFGASGVLSVGYNPTSLSAENQVAFQLAVWKLSHEGSLSAAATLFTGSVTSGLSVSDGNIGAGDVNSPIIKEANKLLSGVLTNAGNGIAPMQLDALNNGSSQDFLIPVGAGFTEIPEPATGAVILGMAALVGAMTRRRSILVA